MTYLERILNIKKDEERIKRVEEIKKYIEEHEFEVALDAGITLDTFKEVFESGDITMNINK